MVVPSRAGRDGRVRPTANIQGGMTLRLLGPHSRLKESHEERKGERPEGQKLKEGKRKPHCCSAQPVFTSREKVWVYVCA